MSRKTSSDFPVFALALVAIISLTVLGGVLTDANITEIIRLMMGRKDTLAFIAVLTTGGGITVAYLRHRGLPAKE